MSHEQTTPHGHAIAAPGAPHAASRVDGVWATNTPSHRHAIAATPLPPHAADAYNAQEDVRDAVVDFVRRRAGQCGIVYCMTQADAEACADHLTDKLKDVGTTAHHYHAGMTQLQRRVVQAA